MFHSFPILIFWCLFLIQMEVLILTFTIHMTKSDLNFIWLCTSTSRITPKNTRIIKHFLTNQKKLTVFTAAISEPKLILPIKADPIWLTDYTTVHCAGHHQ